MSFLLDTNVVSEWVKPRPNPGVVAWLAGTNEDQVFLSVVTLAELRQGIERLATGRRQRQLSAWLENELPMRFEGRVLSIDSAIADACGKLVARSEAAGRPLEAMDAFLAATAQVHQLTLVTRNTAHFDSILKALLNPWT
ncbi:MAG: type II toxin-antitoxin system VapC family toxin [Terriglobia bacterium]|jgi:toxin FitB